MFLLSPFCIVINNEGMGFLPDIETVISTIEKEARNDVVAVTTDQFNRVTTITLQGEIGVLS